MTEIPDDPFKKISIDLDKVLYALFEDSLEGILVVNYQSTIVLANKRVANIFSYEKEEMLGMSVDKLIPKVFRSRHEKHVEGYFGNPHARSMGGTNIFKGLASSGEEILLNISLNPIEIASGKYIIAHVLDQTEKIQINQSLNENENLLRALFQNAVDGIITINSQGIIETINPAAATLFGFQEEEVIGRNIKMLMPEPFHSEHDGYIQNYQETGKAKIIGIGREVNGRKKDGSVFPFYLSVSKIELQGQPKYAGIVHDLTEQKAAEESLKKYSEELELRVNARTRALAQAIQGLEKEVQERKLTEQALKLSQEETQEALKKERELNELKSRFVSMASHEFRTPLATILSSMNLIEKYQDVQFEERRNKHINRVKSNVKNLAAILNDFLSLSKLEEGKIHTEPQEFDLNQLTEEIVEDLRTQVKSEQQISYQFKGENTVVFQDPKLLQNILINLLSNAIKYSPESSLILLRTDLDKDHINIRVKDQGIGIPKEEQEHLFERFFRAKNASNIQGTGLGLSIVKRHVDLMGGEITFSSELNQGTEFHLHIPRTHT